MSSYEKCKSQKIGSIIKLYEAGKLKVHDQKIKSRKQAIAIGISLADKSCEKKIKKKDIKKRIKQIDIGKPTITNIKQAIYLLKKYNIRSRTAIIYRFLIKYLLTNCKGLSPVVKKTFDSMFTKR